MKSFVRLFFSNDLNYGLHSYLDVFSCVFICQGYARTINEIEYWSHMGSWLGRSVEFITQGVGRIEFEISLEEFKLHYDHKLMWDGY